MYGPHHSCHSTLIASLRLVLCIISLSLIPTEATVLCQGCRPVALQEAAGVGISLGFDQISAAVQFCTGTFVNAIHRTSTDDYTRAMTRLHELANFKTSHDTMHMAMNMIKSRKQTVIMSHQITEIADHPTIALHQAQQTITGFTAEDIAADVTLIANELHELFEEVATTYNISERHVYLNLPDSLIRSNITEVLVSSLLHVSALTSLSSGSPRSRSASLDLYNLRNCFDDDERPEQYGDCDMYQGRRINNFLHIELSDKYFAMGFWKRDEGWFFEDDFKAQSYLNQGLSLAGSSMGPQYWIWLRQQIQQLVHGLDDKIDLVVLLDTGAAEPAFRRVIEDVFRDNPEAVPPIRPVEEYAFAAARHSARSAKSALWHGQGGCLHFHQCPMSRFMPEELRWRNVADTGEIIKSEL